jgi:hypothetical protein
LEHQQKGDSDQDDGDESEDSDSGDGGPPENLDISRDDKILTNEDYLVCRKLIFEIILQCPQQECH